MKKIKKAIIPAAGYGTRLAPVSSVIPKEMVACKTEAHDTVYCRRSNKGPGWKI